MRLATLTTSGPAYAALLQESAVSRLPFDGLLIGDTAMTSAEHNQSAMCFIRCRSAHLCSSLRSRIERESAVSCFTGSFTTRRERIHHDTADETTRETLESHVSNFCCSQNLGSFYNGAGEIDGETLN